MALPPLDPTTLRRHCDPASLGFATTEQIETTLSVARGSGAIEPPHMLGQSRAEEAIRFGVGMRQEGYNVFVLGQPGIGKRSRCGVECEIGGQFAVGSELTGIAAAQLQGEPAILVSTPLAVTAWRVAEKP